MTALEADDRTANDVSTDDRWFIAQCKQNAEAIDADRHAIRALIQNTLIKWDRDGLLKRERTVWTRGPDSLGSHEKRMSADEAAAYFADIVDEALGDALSASAREAVEIAQ